MTLACVSSEPPVDPVAYTFHLNLSPNMFLLGTFLLIVTHHSVI